MLIMMNKKILIVEDNTFTRELYKDLLEADGYEIISASDGEAGLIEAAKGGFELILLDIIMPKKDGIAFLRDYKNLKLPQPNGPIIMLSALGEESIIKSCIELGAKDYMVKSELTPDKVLEQLERYLHPDTVI